MKSDFLKKKVIPTLIIYWMHFGGAPAFFVSGVTLDELSKVFHTDVVSVGIVYIFKCVGVLVSGLFVGNLCDIATSGDKKYQKYRYVTLTNLLCSGAFSMILTMVVCALFRNIWLFYFIHLFHGYGFNVLLTVTTVMIKRIWAEEQITLFGKSVHPHSFFLQVMHLIFSLGSFVIPLIISFIFSQGYPSETNIVTIYLLMAVLLAPIFMILVFPVDDQKWFCRTTVLYQKMGKDELTCGNVITNAIEKVKTYSIFRLIFIVCSGLFLFTWVGLSVMYGQAIGVFTMNAEHFSFSNEDASLLISMYYGSVTIGRLLATLKITVMKSSMLMSTDLLGLVLTVFLLVNYLFYHISIVWICTALVGITHASLYGTQFLIPGRFNIQLTGLETSLYVLGGACAEFTPFLALLLMQRYDHHFFIYLFSILVVINCVVFVIEYTIGFCISTGKGINKYRNRLRNIVNDSAGLGVGEIVCI